MILRMLLRLPSITQLCCALLVGVLLGAYLIIFFCLFSFYKDVRFSIRTFHSMSDYLLTCLSFLFLYIVIITRVNYLSTIVRYVGITLDFVLFCWMNLGTGRWYIA